MLTNIYVNPSTATRRRARPGGDRLDAFVAWLSGRGYRKGTIHTYVKASGDFMAWAEAADVAEHALGQDALDNYRTHLSSTGRWQSGPGKCNCYYAGARRFVEFLRVTGVIAPKVEPNDGPVETFRHWLLRHRGLRESTCINYCRAASRFVEAVGKRPEKYSAAAIRTFILDQAKGLGAEGAKAVAIALRNYLRFLIARGECPVGLDDAVPRFAAWRLASLPKHLSASAIERVTATPDTSTPIGTRDRAVLLLLARLGLRAGDVASLRLEDIDWHNGALRLVGKSRRECWLPLPQEVGDAILAYLERARPTVETDAVFVNAMAPYSQLASHTVSQIARRAIRRSGIEAPSHGAHVFRHSFATSMLRRGVSLREIGAILRHESVESTAWYAKVDSELLSTVAQPWPGRSSC